MPLERLVLDLDAPNRCAGVSQENSTTQTGTAGFYIYMYLRILALGAPAFTAAELSVVQTVRADGLVVQLGQHRRADGVSRHG